MTYAPGEWFEGVEQGDRKNFNGGAHLACITATSFLMPFIVSIPVHGLTVAELIRERLTTEDPTGWRLS